MAGTSAAASTGTHASNAYPVLSNTVGDVGKCDRWSTIGYIVSPVGDKSKTNGVGYNVGEPD